MLLFANLTRFHHTKADNRDSPVFSGWNRRFTFRAAVFIFCWDSESNLPTLLVSVSSLPRDSLASVPRIVMSKRPSTSGPGKPQKRARNAEDDEAVEDGSDAEDPLPSKQVTYRSSSSWRWFLDRSAMMTKARSRTPGGARRGDRGEHHPEELHVSLSPRTLHLRI